MSPPICCCQVLRWRHSTRYMPWFLPSQSHLHSLEAALISSCCPGPFSIMFLTHSFFFSNSYILFFFYLYETVPHSSSLRYPRHSILYACPHMYTHYACIKKTSIKLNTKATKQKHILPLLDQRSSSSTITSAKHQLGCTLVNTCCSVSTKKILQ